MILCDLEHVFTIISEDEVIMHRRLNFKLFFIRLKDKTYKKIRLHVFSFFGVSYPIDKFCKPFYRWFDEKDETTIEIDMKIKEFVKNV